MNFFLSETPEKHSFVTAVPHESILKTNKAKQNQNTEIHRLSWACQGNVVLIKDRIPRQ